ncbi:MAG TPA: hypothetical protein GXZ68_06895 [Firmicutes bacterium]|jgi:hypothetical protein|nr:hypothetical protein [Bacillota bacterium]
MPFVAAKCTQCGSNLQVDSSRDAALCPHCETPFVTENAIKNYNTYHQYQIQHANLKVHDERSIQNRIKNAEVFLTMHKDYRKAEEMFQGMTEDAPADYRVWWGILRSQTKEFSDLKAYISIRDLDRYLQNTYDQGLESYIQHHVLNRDFYHKAMAVAPTDVIEELKTTWTDYGRRVKTDAQIYLAPKKESRLQGLTQELDKSIEERNKLERQIQSREKYLSSWTSVFRELLAVVFFGWLTYLAVNHGISLDSLGYGLIWLLVAVVPGFLAYLSLADGLFGRDHVRTILRRNKSALEEIEKKVAEQEEVIRQCRGK